MKRILLIMLALVWLLPSAAMAHSKLHTAVPAVDATVDASPETIDMTFDTKIEKLSTFKLFNEAGEQVETGKAEVSGDKMSGAVPSVLENGVYTVKWTIIGADSHAVEGEYSFTVNAPEPPSPTPSPSPSEEPSTDPSEEPSLEPSDQPSPSPSATAQPESNTGSSNTFPPVMVIVGVIVVAAVLFIVLLRKKSK